MAKITCPVDLIGPKLPNGSDNPFFHDVIIMLAANKPRTFSDDGLTLTIHDLVDLDRVNVEKAIGIHQLSGQSAKVTNYEVMLGVAVESWKSPCPLVDGKNWSDLAGEGTAYTFETINGRNWVLYAAINPGGLDSSQMLALYNAGVLMLTNKQYQAIQPKSPDIDKNPGKKDDPKDKPPK